VRCSRLRIAHGRRNFLIVFIDEFHSDNAGTDSGEFIERVDRRLGHDRLYGAILTADDFMI